LHIVTLDSSQNADVDVLIQAAADLVAEMEALKREQEERLAEERRTLELETAQVPNLS
jgi:hypothetical protein